MSRKAFEAWTAFVNLSAANPTLANRWNRERVLLGLVNDLIYDSPEDQRELVRMVLGCLP